MTTTTVAYEHPEVESLDRDALRALQERRLAALGARLATSPDWVAHFAQAGLHPRDLTSLEALRAVPTLEKSALRERYPFPLLTVPVERVSRFVATSGTTGPPVTFGFTDADRALTAQQMARILRCAGVRPGDRVYQGYGYGLWIGGVAMDWGLAAFGATNFGIGPGRAELVVTWLRDHAYTACTMSPLWLMTLVTTAREHGIDPRRDWALRVGLFGGQSVSSTFRDELEAAMPDGFLAQNIYGTTESGGPNLAISCPASHDRDLMHLINEDTILTEIVDPVTLRPTEPGAVGEIVVTTLQKEASPVVRWRTRDLVRLADDPAGCPCGRRAFPLIGRIVGRSDDMLKIRGVIVYPSQIEDVIAAHPATAKEAWQIYVDRTDRILDDATVAVERRAHAQHPAQRVRDDVSSALHARLGIRLRVEVHEEGTLPRYEAKAVRVIVR